MAAGRTAFFHRLASDLHILALFSRRGVNRAGTEGKIFLDSMVLIYQGVSRYG